MVSLEWETREGYEKPGAICMVEYSTERKEIVRYPKRMWRGGTDRGCIEAPHLTKKGEYYYIITDFRILGAPAREGTRTLNDLSPAQIERLFMLLGEDT